MILEFGDLITENFKMTLRQKRKEGVRIFKFGLAGIVDHYGPVVIKKIKWGYQDRYIGYKAAVEIL